MPSLRTLWNKYNQVKDIDWTPLCKQNPNWKDQEEINDTCVNMCTTTMLFHYNLDLAAVHRKTGAAHGSANPDIILQQVEGLMDKKLQPFKAHSCQRMSQCF
jgi:hypothetical protein